MIIATPLSPARDKRGMSRCVSLLSRKGMMSDPSALCTNARTHIRKVKFTVYHDNV